jgi:hypothetical protein
VERFLFGCETKEFQMLLDSIAFDAVQVATRQLQRAHSLLWDAVAVLRRAEEIHAVVYAEGAEANASLALGVLFDKLAAHDAAEDEIDARDGN